MNEYLVNTTQPSSDLYQLFAEFGLLGLMHEESWKAWTKAEFQEQELMITLLFNI